MTMVVCLDCGMRYDDVRRFVDCPHESVKSARCGVCGFRGDHPAWCSESIDQPAQLGSWVSRGLCQTEVFDDSHQHSKVVEVCERCPVRSECAQFAIDSRTTEGIWGGLTPADRRRVGRGILTLEEAFRG